MEREEENTVKFDKWGYPVRTSSDSCISAINSYYVEVLSYGRKPSVILEAPTHDQSCVLANTLAGYLVSSSNPSKSQFHFSSAKSQLKYATSYEKAVFDAISSLVVKDRDDHLAYELHSKLLKQFPKDLASLKRGQILCFYMGRPDMCLSLVEQVLPQNQEEDYIHGILSFPLLELGRMEDAEKAARKGLEINMYDVWSQHGLCHVLQYECHFKEATEFMEKCSSSWGSCSSFMFTHNWWHVAVCYLEGYSPISKVLEVYDHHIWKELQRIDASRIEVYLNALALLMRVYVRGHISAFGDRLKILVDCLTDQSVWHIEWHLDILILWALASTNKIAEAESLLNTMKSRKKKESLQTGILLAEASLEFGQGNHEKAFELLGPDFDTCNCKIIGASDEQLDVFSEVWYCVLLNTGRFQKAIDQIEKRIKQTEGVPFLWRLLERGYSMAGREDVNEISERAKFLESAYF
ncbi:uncharacterized protein LOC113319160 [Papaver somniferum]|uniref:uncharacterized protein LOC113319160 n=1 Tax=Papaver somniferum TaxID=3469 RepID=UPI000E6FA436|nr:uncharacterized protein LOC113319160 [Papaver somniferum]